jgi:prevent-host-death family protein
METIGIRELRDQASVILRRVRIEKTRYVVTYQGHPIALILPIDQESLVEHLELEGQKVFHDETLTRQLYGLVRQSLSNAELDEIYQQE